ncbi:hypothetical protein BDFB_003411 [Asbolus verrucosus]|uniref:Uncharacterized protein n=1 Tax=Asbolus verrucosus TaxID=1661398 RepID=A0A482VUE5_ASBVE|nr:hypothetical protein BDFB_003411 [Asbolus verrucosus]
MIISVPTIAPTCLLTFNNITYKPIIRDKHTFTTVYGFFNDTNDRIPNQEMSNDHEYISCIKIGGRPIIPPLITPKRREECLKYKIQAIELEKKKERNKLFKKCMEDLARLENQTKDLSRFDDSQPPLYTTLENQLTFAEDNTTHSPSHVPYATFKKLQNLKSETIDVTEYSDEGVKVINKPSETITYNEATPKLIRSNSYTLDSPSPILLAHLEKEARKCVEIEDSDSPSLSPITIIDSETEPKQMQFVETDISIQEVSISTPINTTETKKSQLEPQLSVILDKLPNEHANNIIKILEQQREDQLKNKLLAELVIEEKPMSVSISSSQSLYYSILSSPETPISRNESPKDDLHVVNLMNIKNCKSDVVMRREWAASVIGAAAKGYLVRRLIRTERVQSLIETIKDALLCAIQLHGAEVIEEADVELHRRLIQQVSAACYAFHDIFFSLSVKEQMGIIALDRQRRIEKAKRPSSGSSSVSITRRPQRISSKAVR